MRTSTFLLAGPVAVSAQVLSTITGRVQTATISSGSDVLYTTTWTYSNPATNYLTLTNSEGVCTVSSGAADVMEAPVNMAGFFPSFVASFGIIRVFANAPLQVVTGVPSGSAGTLPAGQQPDAVTR